MWLSVIDSANTAQWSELVSHAREQFDKSFNWDLLDTKNAAKEKKKQRNEGGGRAFSIHKKS